MKRGIWIIFASSLLFYSCSKEEECINGCDNMMAVHDKCKSYCSSLGDIEEALCTVILCTDALLKSTDCSSCCREGKGPETCVERNYRPGRSIDDMWSSYRYVNEGEAPNKKWVSVETKSPMDGSINVTLSKDAESYIYSKNGAHMPRLVVSCVENGVVAYVVTGIRPQYESSGSAYVRIKFDDEKPVRRRMDRSGDGTSLFFAGVKKQVRKMIKSKKLMIEFSPTNLPDKVITFDLTAVGEKVESFKGGCSL